MAAWYYLRDVFIVLGVLLIVSGIFVGWAVFAVFALACSYAATFVFERRPIGGKNGTSSTN